MRWKDGEFTHYTNSSKNLDHLRSFWVMNYIIVHNIHYGPALMLKTGIEGIIKGASITIILYNIIIQVVLLVKLDS